MYFMLTLWTQVHSQYIGIWILDRNMNIALWGTKLNICFSYLFSVYFIISVSFQWARLDIIQQGWWRCWCWSTEFNTSIWLTLSAVVCKQHSFSDFRFPSHACFAIRARLIKQQLPAVAPHTIYRNHNLLHWRGIWALYRRHWHNNRTHGLIYIFLYTKTSSVFLGKLPFAFTRGQLEVPTF